MAAIIFTLKTSPGPNRSGDDGCSTPIIVNHLISANVTPVSSTRSAAENVRLVSRLGSLMLDDLPCQGRHETGFPDSGGSCSRASAPESGEPLGKSSALVVTSPSSGRTQRRIHRIGAEHVLG